MNDIYQRNILALKQRAEDTTADMRRLQVKFDQLYMDVRHLGDMIKALENSIQMLQVKLYSGGATDGRVGGLGSENN